MEEGWAPAGKSFAAGNGVGTPVASEGRGRHLSPDLPASCPSRGPPQDLPTKPFFPALCGSKLENGGRGLLVPGQDQQPRAPRALQNPPANGVSAEPMGCEGGSCACPEAHCSKAASARPYRLTRQEARAGPEETAFVALVATEPGAVDASVVERNKAAFSGSDSRRVTCPSRFCIEDWKKHLSGEFGKPYFIKEEGGKLGGCRHLAHGSAPSPTGYASLTVVPLSLLQSSFPYSG